MYSLLPVAVTSTSQQTGIRQRAEATAQKLGVPFVAYQEDAYPYLLVFTDTLLELHCRSQQGRIFSPITVDFVGGNAGYRRARNCTIKQPLARAVGIKQGFRPTVADGTAGLGQDAFVLASLGCTVWLYERSSVLFTLLEDGLRRALADPRTAAIAGDRIRLMRGDASNLLVTQVPPPYTVYLDPMYPHSSKSALNKKEMRIIRDLVGDDDDTARLLRAARQCATNRVVVKRPKGAGFLEDCKPDYSTAMKNSRFDVYLTAHL